MSDTETETNSHLPRDRPPILANSPPKTPLQCPDCLQDTHRQTDCNKVPDTQICGLTKVHDRQKGPNKIDVPITRLRNFENESNGVRKLLILAECASIAMRNEEAKFRKATLKDLPSTSLALDPAAPTERNSVDRGHARGDEIRNTSAIPNDNAKTISPARFAAEPNKSSPDLGSRSDPIRDLPRDQRNPLEMKESSSLIKDDSTFRSRQGPLEPTPHVPTSIKPTPITTTCGAGIGDQASTCTATPQQRHERSQLGTLVSDEEAQVSQNESGGSKPLSFGTELISGHLGTSLATSRQQRPSIPSPFSIDDPSISTPISSGNLSRVPPLDSTVPPASPTVPHLSILSLSSPLSLVPSSVQMPPHDQASL